MKIRVVFSFLGEDMSNIPQKIEIQDIKIYEIEKLSVNEYRAIIDISEMEYQKQINETITFLNLDENREQTDEDLFVFAICLLIDEYMDKHGILAYIEDCNIISLEMPHEQYKRGGYIHKYAKGGKIEELSLADQLEMVKKGNTSFIDQNDPEIQEALKGIETEPTNKEINELFSKAQKAINKHNLQSVSENQELQQIIEGFRALLDLADTATEKQELQDIIAGFEALMDL